MCHQACLYHVAVIPPLKPWHQFEVEGQVVMYTSFKLVKTHDRLPVLNPRPSCGLIQFQSF